MRILILSDLHDDFWADCNRDPFNGVEHLIAQLDYLILAGDVSNKPKVRWKYAFERLSRLLPLEKVFVFPGNHDFYNFRIDDEDRLENIASSFGVTYVQKKTIVLGGTRILCATLWTDFELGQQRAINERLVTSKMNDYKKIRVATGGYRKLRPSDVAFRHSDHLSWLKQELAKPFDGATYVVTHHAPHPSVLNNYSEGLEAAYASDLGEVIKIYEPECWFFGHSHDAQDIEIGNTKLRNVALGYPEDVLDPEKRIEKLILEI
ncbi:MAG: metallophosphoesterase [Alphaproteobacteria bacterium]